MPLRLLGLIAVIFAVAVWLILWVVLSAVLSARKIRDIATTFQKSGRWGKAN